MKPNFSTHYENHISPALKQPEKSPLSEIKEQQERQAREIARQGDFSKIREKLCENGYLEKRSLDLQIKYYDVLEDALPFLEPQDIEALTILELYDTATFEHSIKTYQIAKAKLEEPLEYDGETIILANKIAEEQFVNLHEFYRACLLHDIGKIDVPHFVITSKIKPDEWSEMLWDLAEREKNEKKLNLHDYFSSKGIKIPPELEFAEESDSLETKEIKKMAFAQFCKKNEIPCFHYVPIAEAVNNPLLGQRAFSEEDFKQLSERNYEGITNQSSLFDVIKIHERQSYSILKDIMHLPKIAELGGVHHGYEIVDSLNEMMYAKSSLSISVILSEFLRLADMQQAIGAKRNYQDPRTALESLKILAKNVNGANIHYFVAYIWIKKDIEKIQPQTEKEKGDYQEILDALEKFKEKMEEIEIKQQ